MHNYWITNLKYNRNTQIAILNTKYSIPNTKLNTKPQRHALRNT